MGIYDTLNEPQREAVLHTDGPLLILAGAGSGKTRVLTHRIAYLIGERGVNPWNILAITFTNKAAGEMRQRVDALVERGAESVWVSTFHSMCVRILRRYAEFIRLDRNFTIYDTDDQKTLMKNICKYLEIDTKIYRERTILAEISSCKNEMITPDDYARRYEGDFRKKKVLEAYREYEKQLGDNNALDFDDLLLKTVQLFETNPEVLDRYQERFHYIMVDEYQDTNTVQFRLVSLLAAKYRNLCVVGDDDQSIYKFRGANIRNILNFEQEYKDAAVIKLEQNYRSTGNILDAANAVISNNTGRKSKTLWTENGAGERLGFEQFENAYDEAEYVAGNIARKVRTGQANYQDFAILYRTNAQSRMFEEKFIAGNIPYKIVGGVNFYARREIKDLLAYLKTIDNGQDDLAVRRIINVPKRGIGLTTVNRVQDYALEHEISFYEALRSADLIPGIGRGRAKLDSFVALIEHLKDQLETISLTELMNQTIEMTGYVDLLREEGTEEAEARIENIDELLSKIVDYEDSCGEDETPSLSGFLEEVALVSDIDSLDEEQDYVVLMTLHSAKGLEFPEVYLVGMEDGLFPGYMSINTDDPSEIEEERRLCYVGITRAERNLTLTCARRRMVRGEIQYNAMSRFMKEIPGSLIGGGTVFEQEKPKARETSAYVQAKRNFKTQAFGGSKPVRQFAVKTGKGLEYGVGDRVRHMKFGIGTVTAINEGGRDYEVTVDFDNVGTKKMFAAFARLAKL